MSEVHGVREALKSCLQFGGSYDVGMLATQVIYPLHVVMTSMCLHAQKRVYDRFATENKKIVIKSK